MFKKSVSLLLALIMVAAVFTVIPASAAETEAAADGVSVTGVVPTGKDNVTPTVPAVTEAETTAGSTRTGVIYNDARTGYWSYEIDLAAGTVTITGATELVGDLVIPTEIEGYPVTAIAPCAVDCKKISSVTVPDSVTAIGELALGYSVDGDEFDSIFFQTSGFILKGSERSAAEAYAKENDLTFVNVNAASYPLITSIENTENGAKIKWSSFPGAESYRVYYKNANGNWVRMTTTKSREYTDTSVKGGEERLYTVRALNGKDTFVSEYSRRGWSNLFIEAPTVTLSNDENGVMIKWNACKGAVRYRVYYYGSHGWTRMAETAETSYLDTDVRSGNTYTYTVRCITADGKGFTGDYHAGKKIRYVAAPRITSFENTENGVKIKWKASKGANFYRIYYKNKNGNGWTRLASKYLTEYTDTSVKSGETRVYTIRCLNEKEDFVSDFVHRGFATTFIEAPTVTLSNDENGVMIKWNACKGAVRYRVYYYGDKGWTRMAETAETSYLDTDVRSGSSYTYTVRCIPADGKGFTSDYHAGKKIRYVAAPRITSFENTENGVKIKWKASKGADFYRIYYKNKNGDGWTRLASKYLTEYTDTSVKDGETRVYTIRCLNEKEDFVSDFVGEGFATTYYAPPVISKVTEKDGDHLIEWKARDGVAAYRLYRKTLGGSWSRLFDSVTDASYQDKVEKDTIYAYTLRYLDGEGELISDYLDDVKYYKNGKAVDGKTEYNGKTYYFDNGHLRSGLQRINGKLYYYNANGSLSKDTLVKSGSDYYYADKNGVCCETEEIRLAAEFMYKYCKGDTLKAKMKSGFMYLADHFPYQRYYDPPVSALDMPRMATTCFKNRNANCYRYAAAFCCLARIAGYRARVAVGTTGGLPHGWTEVYVDGRWLICDPDANIPKYNKADYAAYMMTSHFWQLSKSFSSELTIENGKAVWK